MKTKKERAMENIKQAKELLAKAELELEEPENVKFPQEGEYFLGAYIVEKSQPTLTSTSMYRDFNKRKVAEISRIENMIQRALRQTADELCPDFVASTSNDKYFIFISKGSLGTDWYTRYAPLGSVSFDTEENAKIAIERITPMHEELQRLWGLE